MFKLPKSNKKKMSQSCQDFVVVNYAVDTSTKLDLIFWNRAGSKREKKMEDEQASRLQ